MIRVKRWLSRNCGNGGLSMIVMACFCVDESRVGGSFNHKCCLYWTCRNVFRLDCHFLVIQVNSCILWYIPCHTILLTVDGLQGSAKRLVKAALQEAARKREMRYSDLRKIDKKVRRHFHDDITVIVLFLNHEIISRGTAQDHQLSVRSALDH